MNFLDGKELAVIGDPIEHSLSPVIQQAMLDELGVCCTYGRILVRAGETAQWLQKAEQGKLAGFNATMPHKSDLVPLMDTLSEDARMYSSVNTVVLHDGKRHGFNTDGEGFLRSLLDEGMDPAEKTIAVLGAGGAARSVVLKLASCRAAKITVLCRTPAKANGLVHASTAIHVAGMNRTDMEKTLAQADLLVNCTPLGMDGVSARFDGFSFLDALPASAFVCDVIYRPLKTRLLAEAEQRGHHVMNGLGMLIHQAILSIEHFSGQKLDTVTMKNAIQKRLMPVLQEK
ncbi:MAG: shikimate dehydrogenase [Mailhella sp.]|nr:shikimate dehydrogenase [Mailhella sp.]